MTGDTWATRMQEWAKQHGVLTEQEASAADAAVTLWARSPGDPQFRARLSPGRDDEVLVVGRVSVPDDMEEVLNRISAMRSSLVRWSPIEGTGATEVSVVLFEDGLTKLQLLSAVDEVRKLIEVVGWELQAAKATEDFLAETHRLLDEAQPGLEEADQPLSTETPTQQLASPGEDGLSSTKPCPRCARDVKTAAKFCPFCGYQLPDLVERV